MKFQLTLEPNKQWQVRQINESAWIGLRKHFDKSESDIWSGIITPEAERIGSDLVAIARDSGATGSYTVDRVTREPDDLGYISVIIRACIVLDFASLEQLESFLSLAALNDYDCVNSEQAVEEYKRAFF